MAKDRHVGTHRTYGGYTTGVRSRGRGNIKST